MESNNNNDFGKIIRNVGLFIGIPLVFFLILWLFLDPRTSSSNVKYSDYVAYFENNQVESYTLDLGNGNLELTLREAFRTKDINKDGKIDERDYVLKYTVPDVSPVSYTHLDVYKRQHHPLRGQPRPHSAPAAGRNARSRFRRRAGRGGPGTPAGRHRPGAAHQGGQESGTGGRGLQRRNRGGGLRPAGGTPARPLRSEFLRTA